MLCFEKINIFPLDNYCLTYLNLKMTFIVKVVFLLFITTSAALYEGDDCVVSNTNQNGKCISVLSCEYAKRLLQSQQIPQNCGFNSQLPLVCCPINEETKPPPGLRSIEKCKEYHNWNRQVFAVAGGTKALSKEFPHMAAVGYGDQKNILWLCGGSLISEQFVLTAAHCTRSQEFGTVKWVRLGDLDLKNTTDDANPQDLSVDRFFAHPDYKPPSHYNDIALLKLEKKIDFGIYFKPACLQTDTQLPFNKLQATGWGKTDYFGDSSSHLLKVDLDIIEIKKCAKSYSNVSPRRLPSGILNEKQICAGDSSETGKDTCPGDSGGPLHFWKDGVSETVGHYVVAGVTSFGKGCGIGRTVGVYTRVSAYIEWIENIVWT